MAQAGDESKDDHAWLVQNAERKDFTEVEIEGHNNARRLASTIDDLEVRRALQTQRPHAHGFVSKLFQEFDGFGRDASIRQKPHVSRAQGMNFVLRKGRRISECLPHVFFFEVGQFRDDLRGRHPIGDEVTT
jgi:hypothetical protein